MRPAIAVACLAAALAPLLLRFHLLGLLANMRIHGWRIDAVYDNSDDLERQTHLGHLWSELCRTKSFFSLSGVCTPTFEPLRVQARLHLNVTSLSEDPPIHILDGLVSRAECERVVELTEDDLERRAQLGTSEDGATPFAKRLDVRTNSRVFLVKGGRLSSEVDADSHQLIKRIHSRLAVLFDVPLDYITLQRHRTLPGQFFRPHLDFIAEKLFLPSGPYVWQILLYCSDVADGAGGQTRFPDLGVQLRPQMGRALAWPSTFAATIIGDARLLHESVTLKRGVKHALFATINAGPPQLWGGWLQRLESWIDDRVLAAVRGVAGA